MRLVASIKTLAESVTAIQLWIKYRKALFGVPASTGSFKSVFRLKPGLRTLNLMAVSRISRVSIIYSLSLFHYP